MAKFDNANATYRILNYLKKSEAFVEFDDRHFCPEYFKLTERQFSNVIERLVDDGFVKGVSVEHGCDGYSMVSLSAPRITSHGLEYLQENSLMRKAANIAKGIAEVIS